jgi:glucarate dehydratase
VKIVDARATPVFVPIKHPLRWSFGLETGTTRVLIELITDEGVIGLGETKGGQAVADAVMQTRPLYVGLDPLEVSRIARRFGVYRLTSEQIDRIGALKLAGAGIEMAAWDLAGKLTGKRCGDLWGGIDREQVEFTAYVFYRYKSVDEEGGYSDPQFVADYTRELLETYGFRDMKLKNGVLDPPQEIETVRRIRETCGSRLRNIRVDPNQVWSVETSIRVLRALAPYDIEFCEDPTWGIEGMSLTRRDSPIPLATNMCCVSFEQIPLVVRTRALDIILGDMHFWGGPTALMQLAKICETFNLGLSLHSDRELGVSTAAIVHMAASQPMVSHAIDSHLLDQADDVITEPFRFRNGGLKVPDGPGLGVELDREKVEKYHRRYREQGDVEEFQDPARAEWRPRLPLW